MRKGLLATLFSVTAFAGFGFGNPADPDAAFETPKPLIENTADSVADYVDLFSGSNGFERLFEGELGSSQSAYVNAGWQQSMRREQTAFGQADYRIAMENYLNAIKSARGMGLRQQADFVNTYVNNYIRYEHDSVNFRQVEYFASGVESVVNRTGDCDDYAIMKYSTLRALGVPAHRLYLCSVMATDAQGSGGHMLLLMNIGKDKPHFVTLDNRSYTLRDPLEIVPGDFKAYQYEAAVNENGVWLAHDNKELALVQRIVPKPEPAPVVDQVVMNVTPEPAPTPETIPTPAPANPAPEDVVIYGHSPAYWLKRLGVGAAVFTGALTVVNALSGDDEKKKQRELSAITAKAQSATKAADYFRKSSKPSSKQNSNTQKTLDLLVRVANAQKSARLGLA